jgi:poly-gamma-glutamate synthase PgsB/CapB
MHGLIIGLIVLIIFGVFEYQRHKNYRKQIPLIIHINGTRGKSSVTRLIAAGLRAGKKKVIAKTTGSAPRLIYENGNEVPIIRHFGANIREQLKIIKFVAKRQAEILVLECMAVTPEYQWVTEQNIVKSNIGVITNSREDHLDVMGPGLKNVTLSLCNTLPHHSIAFTTEKKMYPLMKKQAHKMHTDLHFVEHQDITNDMMKGFSYIEHKENVALSLAVCEHCGVDKEAALKGMYEAIPDIGAAEIFKCKYGGKNFYFAHSFAANDPESTEALVSYILSLYPDIDSVSIVLNTRSDRMFRSKQLMSMLKNQDFNMLYLIGDEPQTIRLYALSHGISTKKIVNCGWINGHDLIETAYEHASETEMFLGIGNIGGNGAKIVAYFREKDGENV